MQQTPLVQEWTALLAAGDQAGADKVLARISDPNLLVQAAIWAIEHVFPDASLKAFAKAAATPGVNPGIYFDWTNALLLLCRYHEALEVAQRGAAKLPGEAMSQVLLAMAHERLQDLDTALQLYRKALAQEPENPFIHHHYGCALLLHGDYLPGWQEHEWRLYMQPEHQAYHPVPRWTGQHRQGGALLVYTEQGFGDTLQFCRYLMLIERSQGPIYLACQPALEALIRYNFPDIHIVGQGEQISVAWQVGLMSLPAVFGLSEKELGGSAPYLRAPEAQSRGLVSDSAKIGLVWSSGRHTGMGIYAHRGKSMALPELESQLWPQADYYSFQTGPESQDARTSTRGIRDLSSLLSDFAATADWMTEMDLMITVDTASAHLAAALGLETWVFLPYAPNWRWQLGRRDTPWYNKMRLYRPEQALDWSPALAAMGRDLRAWLSGGN